MGFIIHISYNIYISTWLKLSFEIVVMPMELDCCTISASMRKDLFHLLPWDSNASLTLSLYFPKMQRIIQDTILGYVVANL